MMRLLLPFLYGFTLASVASAEPSHDIVIYGGTSAGLIAGIQAKRLGKSVVVIEPSRRIGGLTTGGLGQTDIGNKHVIGGLSQEFYQRVASHYVQAENWTWQTKARYGRGTGQSQTTKGEATMWTFEPSTALKIYQDWIADLGLEVVYGERLKRTSGVAKDGARITSITMESGRTFPGTMFIDATYEGDLLAAAGVSYSVGREANADYGETLNGVQTAQAKHHNLVQGVDPHVVKGDASSGLLPGIDAAGPGPEGGGDRRVQAYCFRMCLTNHPENRIPFHRPAGYNEGLYELLFRNYEAGETRVPWINSGMPNRKTDTNNRLGVSTDFIGQNYAYPEASYAEREDIIARHRHYQQGLMWSLATHPRIPAAIRKEVSTWGVCKDEFVEGQGWQEQLYIREARRMRGAFVMTQNHCQQRETVHDSIGMGAYTMDSHHVQRYVDAKGHVRNEGDVQVGGFPPYPISYRSIIPKAAEAENLLVPVCLSATHMAFGSIRMEPVFMVLAQSAASAASLAIDDHLPVQQVDYNKLRDRLEQDEQILSYASVPKPGGHVRPLNTLRRGIVVDETAAKRTGHWQPSILAAGIHRGYHHDGNARDGRASAAFTGLLPTPGLYEVHVAYVAHPNRATKVPVTITHRDGIANSTLNQRTAPTIDGHFTRVGVFPFGRSGTVTLSNAGTDGYVIIDAVRWMPVASP